VPIVRGRTRRNSPSLHAAVHLAFTAKTARTPRKWVNSFITYWQGNFANIDTPATRFMGEAWLIRRLQQTGPNARRTLSMAFAAYLAICSISNFVLFIYCSLRALGVFAVRKKRANLPQIQQSKYAEGSPTPIFVLGQLTSQFPSQSRFPSPHLSPLRAWEVIVSLIGLMGINRTQVYMKHSCFSVHPK
jgi:hypothetical protein